jgi:hypothetical protein
MRLRSLGSGSCFMSSHIGFRTLKFNIRNIYYISLFLVPSVADPDQKLGTAATAPTPAQNVICQNFKNVKQLNLRLTNFFSSCKAFRVLVNEL